MRILHTSDWHVGRTIRGRSRHEEHEAVLAEIVEVARKRSVDLVLAAGDLFESASPTAEAQGLVWRTLLALRATGAEVAVIAGNHDNHALFDAMAPLLGELGIRVLPDVTAETDGGLAAFAVKGQPVRLAMLPFLSQRAVVRAADLMAEDAAESAGRYADRYRKIVTALTRSFGTDSVNIVLAHAYVRGARAAGGEREAHIDADYAVDAVVFPASAHYVALGHLHATQEIPGSCPIRYSGSPIQVDFGEERDVKNVLLVDVAPGDQAQVKRVELGSGRRLRTLRGTLGELGAHAGKVGDDYLRVIVRERGRAGLAAEVEELLGPGVVQVHLEAPPEEGDGAPADAPARLTLAPRELLSTYLESQECRDERIVALFSRLLDEELQGPAAP